MNILEFAEFPNALLKNCAVRIIANSIAMQGAIFITAYVFIAISICVCALPVVFAVSVLTRVLRVVGPDFFALAVLLVLEPLALVARTISVLIDSVAMGLVVLPLTVVNVTICVDESSPAICLIVEPEAFIHGSISPDLDTATFLLLLGVPLSLVGRSIVERNFAFLSQALVRCFFTIVKRLKTFTNLQD